MDAEIKIDVQPVCKIGMLQWLARFAGLSCYYYAYGRKSLRYNRAQLLGELKRDTALKAIINDAPWILGIACGIEHDGKGSVRE